MKWSIELNSLVGGFAPAWYKESYPSYGNKSMAGAMSNVDMSNPGYLQQGPGLANLTAGTQAAAVTTLIKGSLDKAVSSAVAYGVGGAKLYQFSLSAVTNAGIWPHTIDKAAVTGEDGEDVAHYKGALYYTYNHSGSAGDIGKYDLASTFDDDWGSTVPSGMSALTSNPHPMCNGGNDVLYIANGIYVTSYDGTTLIPQALDLPVDSVIVDLAWVNDRLWILANRPNTAGTNKNSASVYVWDGTTTSWEVEIKLMGTASAFHVKNGLLFVFYMDLSSSGGYKLGYISGNGVTDVANFTGALPTCYQVTDYKDFILWNANGSIWAFGSGDKDLPIKLFQIADGGYANVGTLITPFGTPMVSSWDAGSNYRFASFSGYDVASTWKSLVFDITGAGQVSRIDSVRFNFEKLLTGARVDWAIVNNKGETIYSDIISFAKLGAVTTAFYPLNGRVAENFRIQLDYASGDTTNTVQLKSAKVYGNSN